MRKSALIISFALFFSLLFVLAVSAEDCGQRLAANGINPAAGYCRHTNAEAACDSGTSLGATSDCEVDCCKSNPTAAAAPEPAEVVSDASRPTCGVEKKHKAGDVYGHCGGLKGYTNKDVIAANCGADGKYHAVLHQRNLKPCGTDEDDGDNFHKCANGADASDKTKNYWTQRGGTAGLENKDPKCTYAVTCNVDGSYSTSAKAISCDEGKQEVAKQPAATTQPAATQCPTCASFPSGSSNYCYTVRCSSSGCAEKQVACPGQNSIATTAAATCQIANSGAATSTVPAVGTSCAEGAASLCKDGYTLLKCAREGGGSGNVWTAVSCSGPCSNGECRVY